MVNNKENHVDAINTLRAVGAVCVYLLHATIFEPNINSLFKKEGLSFLFRTPAWGGVWLFLVLGGYLAGKGFASERYRATITDSLRYYRKRFVKTLIPVYSFIFLCVVLVNTEFLTIPEFWWRIFTFTYRGAPGSDGIGATWYVFVLAWMYLLTPPAAFILDKLKNNRLALLCVCGLLMAYGLTYRVIAYKSGLPWNDRVYVPVYANLDLYFGGMSFAYLNRQNADGSCTERKRRLLKIGAAVLLAVLIISNCYVYNRMCFGSVACSFLYMYVYPTFYLLVLVCYLWAFDCKRSIKSVAVSWSAVKQNPLRVIDAFANISFEFYLFHSLILKRLANYFTIEDPLLNHLTVLLTVGVITVIFAIAYQRIFSSKTKRTNYRGVYLK